MTDSILLEVASGSAEAVEECLRRFTGPVWSLARRFAPSLQDAEDAVQDIFLDVWRSSARYNPEAGSELTFILTIARRRLIDRTRRRSRAPDVQGLAEPEMLPESPVQDVVESADEAGKVLTAMESLRPEQRNVLELSLVHGHTHAQVAARTGMPLGTVKSHARRGLRRVRELLGLEPETGSVRQ